MSFFQEESQSISESACISDKFFQPFACTGAWECELKKCCKAYKKKGRHCKKCPKKD